MGAGEVTPREQVRWQMRAHRALGELLTHAHTAGWPPMTWSVQPTGVLVGDVDTLSTAAQPRAVFEAWVEYLQADRWDDVVRATGSVHLHADFAYRVGGERVRGAIRCDIRPDDEAGER